MAETAGWWARARLWAARAATAAGAAALLGLAVLLGTQAAESRGERAAVEREGTSLDREIARMRRANQALRDEVRALEHDPVYVESILRKWKRIGPNEKPVESGAP